MIAMRQLVAAQRREPPQDGDVAHLVLGPTHRNDVPSGFLQPVTPLPRRCPAPPAGRARTCHRPRAITSSTSPSSSSTTRSASAPATSVPFCSRSSRAGLAVKAGSTRSSGWPQPSSSFSVPAMADGLPTSIAVTRPSPSKTGRQPPPSELTVTRSAGSPASR